MVDKEAKAVFDSLVHIKVGVGSKVLFWTDRWIHGFVAKDIATLIAGMVDKRVKGKRMVREALLEGAWDHDIMGQLSFTAHMQLIHLQQAVATIHRNVEEEDAFLWPWSATGSYSAKSTYKMLCQGMTRFDAAQCIWRSWAPLKCKIFAWLASQYRLWTSDRRARHELQ